MFIRSSPIGIHMDESFFLWGPRQCGKTTLLEERFKDSVYLDFLNTEVFMRYQLKPSLLFEEITALLEQSNDNKPLWCVIDEVQKVPQILDEVQRLMKNPKMRFVLCGSSARKLRRTHANLLGGRALRYELHGLISREMNEAFDLLKILNHGYLPKIYLSQQPARLHKAYILNYLKEEIIEESIVRKLEPFSRFLEIAALGDTEQINYATIGRDCHISESTVASYFGILADTLIGRFLPAYIKSPKRRVMHIPKFYFFDVGIVNFLSKKSDIKVGTPFLGKVFENWIFHELVALLHYKEMNEELSYWKLSSGSEVDFVIGDMKVAIEVKAQDNIHSDHLKGLRELYKDYPHVNHRIIVSFVKRARKTEDGIWILPYQEFLKNLWNGDFL
ncbi:MAG: ATP-binding protein [Deltaproteobacteria bacterium]|nr:ATP-binding protein [Deltaproteobacteria bacterium]